MKPTSDDLSRAWSTRIVRDWVDTLLPETAEIIHLRDITQLRIMINKAFQRASKGEMPGLPHAWLPLDEERLK